MKRLLASCLALTLATAAIAKDFEGKLEMTLTTGKKSTPMTYFIKSGKIRFETQPDAKHTSVGLIDSAAGEMTILMVDQKMYMTIGTKKVGELAPDFTFTETGKTETIAGKTCSEFVATDKKNTYEIWATGELPGVSNIAEAFGRRGQRSAWEEEMIRRNMFALRVVTKNKKGVEQSRMECTAVSEEKLDDSLFRVPDDFKKLPGLGDLFGR